MMSLANRTRRSMVALSAAGLVLSGSTLVGVAPAAAATCGSALADDVNGDGHSEVVVGNNTGQNDASINLFYGHDSGLVVDAKGTARDDQRLTQTSLYDKGPTVPRFGATSRFGDFNGDGCADLAVGAEDAVGVFDGSRTGLHKASSQRFDVGLIYNNSPAFGRSIAVADLDQDGFDDLAVGLPLLSIGTVKYSIGGLYVLWGSEDGLNGTRLPSLVTIDDAGIPDESRAGDTFGIVLADGDFNGDGRRELAASRYQNGDPFGAIQVVRYADGRFIADAPIDRATPGVPGDLRYERFGTALIAGDVNGDGSDDLAIGAPAGQSEGPGSVVLLYGGGAGLTGAQSQEFRAGVAGVPGTAESGADFGNALAMGDLDGDGRDDLIIGADYATVAGKQRGGTVTLLYGSSTGVSSAQAQLITESAPGVVGAVSEGDEFGCAVSAVNLQSPTRATLLIGACGEKVGKHEAAGMLYQIPIGSTGPQLSRTTRISADSRGVKGLAGRSYEFGGAISESSIGD